MNEGFGRERIYGSGEVYYLKRDWQNMRERNESELK